MVSNCDVCDTFSNRLDGATTFVTHYKREHESQSAAGDQRMDDCRIKHAQTMGKAPSGSEPLRV